ncbi:MAG: hypothetical protein OQJ89_08820 [Kangiellaceae bacterium]|nr:hypothetical protein [Kangiellaceae bacterium]MCW8997758.1 hypothetical protein [Kangiellaceae bacterium]MCW9017052.1 hypothetical protein [Kangiellaceae bacterium]
MKLVNFKRLIKLSVTTVMIIASSFSFAGDAKKKEAEQPQKDFDFLIGNWDCEWQRFDPKGKIQSKIRCKWDARYTFDGLMVQDDFRMFNSSGKLVYAGTTLRNYSPQEKQWKNTFLDVVGGPSFEDFVGKKVGGEIHIQTTRKNANGQKAFMKIRFHNISESGFSWEGKTSSDGKNWTLDSRIISKKG